MPPRVRPMYRPLISRTSPVSRVETKRTAISALSLRLRLTALSALSLRPRLAAHCDIMMRFSARITKSHLPRRRIGSADSSRSRHHSETNFLAIVPEFRLCECIKRSCRARNMANNSRGENYGIGKKSGYNSDGCSARFPPIGI